MAAAVDLILQGKIPEPFSCPEGTPEESIRLIENVNQLIACLKSANEFIHALAKGNLGVDPPRKNFLVDHYKQLQSNLLHLTWQAGQVAKGDFDQKIDFMGDFSDSFNSMIASLREKKDLEDELGRAVLAAEKANEAKSLFLAHMSHEIRTPMNGVLGIAELLLQMSVDEEKRELIEIIRNSADSLLGIISDILDFSKIEAGKLSLESIPFELFRVMDGVAEFFSPAASAKGIELRVFQPRDLPWELIGDPTRLRQIFMNLMGNALKFTSTGSITLSAHLLSEDADKALIRWEVQDTGPGISQDRLSLLFQSFSQADSGISRKYGGTGLGLAISKSLAELMGGSIGVDSQVGKGSCFWVTIPMRKAPDPFPQNLILPHHPRVLLKAPEFFEKTAIVEHLSRLGCRLHIAETREETLREAETSLDGDDPYVLILCSFESFDRAKKFMEEMRVRGSRSNTIPVLAIETLKYSALHAKLKEIGFADVIPRPLRFSRLHGIIKKALNLDFKEPGLPRKSAADLVREQFSGYRCLVAEDNPTNQLVLGKVLQRAGLSVTMVSNGVEALKTLAGESFDIIILDLEMPEMDGLTTAREIRRRESDPSNRQPICALSAHATSEFEAKCHEAGMDGFLSKPIRTNDLFKLFLTLLRPRN